MMLDLDAELRRGVRRAIDAAVRQRVALPADTRSFHVDQYRRRQAAGALTTVPRARLPSRPRGGKHGF